MYIYIYSSNISLFVSWTAQKGQKIAFAFYNSKYGTAACTRAVKQGYCLSVSRERRFLVLFLHVFVSLFVWATAATDTRSIGQHSADESQLLWASPALATPVFLLCFRSSSSSGRTWLDQTVPLGITSTLQTLGSLSAPLLQTVDEAQHLNDMRWFRNGLSNKIRTSSMSNYQTDTYF